MTDFQQTGQCTQFQLELRIEYRGPGCLLERQPAVVRREREFGERRNEVSRVLHLEVVYSKV
jgi:hypothetical protein